MTKHSKFLQLFITLSIFGSIIGCKTTTKSSTTSSSASSTAENTTADIDEATTDTVSPLSKLGQLSGSTVTTTTVEENASGMEKALPFNKDIRTGVLENGMTYYIRKNAKPENRIDMHLAVNAGSMQEEDDQRGLAHFVEHMAFNGTKHFEKNELVDYLESTGLRFGADLNAYTTFDKTVYRIQIPTDKEGLVDKGLLVMSDWATGVSMDGDEIDKERGIIESERRTRLGASERMRQVWWPKLFHESRYADRWTIGTLEVIRNAPYERLRTFYKDWYRPNLQAIIVVGDLDVDEMEQKIKEKFSVLKNPENPKEKIDYEVPDHDETFVVITTDKEAPRTTIDLTINQEPIEIKTLEDYRTSLVYTLYNGMLNDRFSELGQDKDAPFFSAYGGFFESFVKAKDWYSTSATTKEKGLLESFKILLREHARVLQHGFTETELERQKLAMLKRAERQFKERDKVTSTQLAEECVNHFLDEEPIFGAERELQLTKEFLPTIKLQDVNVLAKKWLTEKNRLVTVEAPDKEGIDLPTEAEIRKELENFKTLKVEPYKDKYSDLPLLAKEPTAGKVVATKEFKENDFNVTELQLSNGVRVVLKPTDFQNDQILLRAFSPGGHSVYGDADYLAAANAANIIDESGIGQFDLIALERKLISASVNLSPYIGELYEGFSGSSSVEDFETLLKLVYLYGTAPREDKDAFARYVEQSKEEIRSLQSNPQFFFSEQITNVLSGNNPRSKIIPTEKEIDAVNYQRVIEIYKDRFKDFSDFTFVLVGNFEVEKIKPQLEKYLGGLPNTNRKENWKDIGIKRPLDGAVVQKKKGIEPQARVYIGFLKEEDWSMEKAHLLTSVTDILSITVLENLREDKGGVYSPQVASSFGSKPKGLSEFAIAFECAPENVDNLIAAAKDEIQKLQKEGPSDENLQKIMEQQRRGYETALQKNNVWASILYSYYRDGRPLEDMITYKKLIDNLNKKAIQKAANNYINLDKAVIVTVKPEKVTEGKP